MTAVPRILFARECAGFTALTTDTPLRVAPTGTPDRVPGLERPVRRSESDRRCRYRRLHPPFGPVKEGAVWVVVQFEGYGHI